jgi:Rod binding domain-containing protein
MTTPISRIGRQQAVTREAGSEGHEQVARRMDGVNEKVMNVAKMYERQFLGEMFKAMRATVSETEKPSMAQNIYNSQRDDQYIDAWSEQGGVGFSNIIYDQIMERFFGQTQQGRALKKQGMIPLTNRDITNVSQVKNGVATPIVPRAAVAPASASTMAKPGEARTVENTEPMPAPTPPKADMRTTEERVAAGEHFPETAVARDSIAQAQANAHASANDLAPVEQQTALQIEVRPSPTGQPAKIQAPWDATVVGAAKLDGTRTAVTLEHGQGLRSTLVFDGVLATNTTVGQKIPRGEAIATLNQDAKSFLWNLAPQSAQGRRAE